MSRQLPPTGDAPLDWAARHMPLLAATFEELGGTFDGLHVGITLHVEPKTAVLCQWLLESGARVSITGNLGTTVPATAEALRGLDVEVLGGRDDSFDEREAHLDTLVAARCELYLDNGGELISRLAGGAPRGTGFRGATEETTTGGLHIRSLPTPPDFPVIVINDSRLKLLVENEFGVGQSVVQGFMNATNLMVPGLRAGVIGYGPCGKGTADSLRALGATVTVADLDPFRQLDALMRGHAVSGVGEIIEGCDVVFLATGARHVIGRELFGRLRDGIILVGVGHEGLELDLAALRAAASEARNLSPEGGDAQARTRYRLADGREVVVLHDSQMINLTAANGNPIQAMDLGLSLQARSLAAIAKDEVLTSGAQAVPEDIDRVLAASLVSLLR